MKPAAAQLVDHLKPQVDALASIYAASAADPDVETVLVQSLSHVSTVERFALSLAGRFEYEAYAGAVKELQYSLLVAAVGGYRQAFSSLRLFFELFLAGLEFSASERPFRGWKLGRENIVWSRINDVENGILSKNFCALFFDSLKEEVAQYRVIAGTVYTECSQFVHGNPNGTAALPDSLQFKKEVVVSWADKLDTMMLVVSFAYSLRFLLSLDTSAAEAVKEDLLSQLGTVEPIRIVLGGSARG